MTPTLFAELDACLAARFPESDLAQAAAPFIHDVHLRFDLGGQLPNGSDERLAQVASRAATIIAGCFAPADRLLLLVNDWPGPDAMFGDTTPGHLYQLLGRHAVLGTDHRRVTMPREPGDDEPYSFEQVLVAAPFANLAWREILAGIANYEQGREPGIGQGVYFIAPENGIVFHMYDDRGFLVFADDPARIAHLYRAHNDWIVDHWREAIDAVFATRRVHRYRKLSADRALAARRPSRCAVG
ncbi:MAG: DUF3885 domain-containing protein [Gemmatimonadetes bacterium]|nr:DUF3885 domain-containing protein [Gemmatimonadota bacterium]